MSDTPRAELAAGALVLVVAAGFVALSMGQGRMIGDSYPLRAAFPSIEGIEVGTDVRMAGVPIGRVTSIHLNPETYQAEATLSVPESVRLPTDSAALIQQDGLLGGGYLELQPGGSPDLLAAGDEIEDVQGSVSLLSLMMKFVDSKSGSDAPGDAGAGEAGAEVGAAGSDEPGTGATEAGASGSGTGGSGASGAAPDADAVPGPGAAVPGAAAGAAP